MKRLIIISLMASFTVTVPCIAGVPSNRFTITLDGEYLAVGQGGLILSSSTFGSISDDKDAKDRWYILGTKIKSTVGGGYLAYDPDGANNAVVLKSWWGTGTDWTVSVPSKSRGAEGKKAVIRAASGSKKGWYLTVEDVEVEKNGRKVPVPHFILAKDPPKKLKAERIWKHK